MSLGSPWILRILGDQKQVIEVDAIVIDFAATRTHIKSVSLVTPTGARQLEMASPYRALSSECFTITNLTELRVVHDGEAPRVAEIRLQATADPGLVAHAAISRGYSEARPKENLAAYVTPLQVVLTNLIGTLEPPITRDQAMQLRREAMAADMAARHFFCALDEATTNVAPEFAARIGGLTSLLQARVVDRSVWARAVPSSVPVFHSLDNELTRDLRRTLFEVSTMFRTLSSAFFAGHDDWLLWAFEQFATNALAVWHRDRRVQSQINGHGAPDSSQFFLFGELALACIREEPRGPHHDYWVRLLPTLVQVTRAFVEHRENRTKGFTVVPPSYQYQFEETWTVSRVRMDELRAEYEGVAAVASHESVVEVLEDHFTWMTGRAFRLQAGAPTGNSRRLTNPPKGSSLLPTLEQLA